MDMKFRWWKCILLAALLLLSTSGLALADDEAPAPKAWAPMQSAAGPAGTSFPAGMFAVGGNIVNGESDGTHRHSKFWNDATDTSKWTEIVKLRYGILDNLDIRTSTPFYNIHTNTVATGVGRDNYGIGDTAVLLHSLIMDQRKGAPFSIGIDYGGIVPTGTVGPHSVNAIGNSAWGWMGGVGATYFLGSNRFDTEVNYTTFYEGAKDFKKGDRMRWNASYAYALNGMWDLGFETNYEHNDQTELKDVKQKDASDELYGGPKLVFKYAPWGTNVGLLASKPLYRWYQGTKSGSDDYRFDLKLIKTFDVGKIFD
jgi:hypothetical protein